MVFFLDIVAVTIICENCPYFSVTLFHLFHTPSQTAEAQKNHKSIIPYQVIFVLYLVPEITSLQTPGGVYMQRKQHVQRPRV